VLARRPGFLDCFFESGMPWMRWMPARFWIISPMRELCNADFYEQDGKGEKKNYNILTKVALKREMLLP